MVSIVVLEIENSGNLGAIARTMANFDLKDLVLINPKCKITQETKNRAKHAQHILKKVKIKNKIERFDYLIGTTAKLGRDYNLPRTPMTPEQLSKKIKNKKGRIGILIGRESVGLTNEEIKLCDFIVSIPASKKYPTMNISHACSILFYELFKEKRDLSKEYKPVGKKEKEHLIKTVNNIINKQEYSTKEKKQTQKTLWKRIIGKAMLTNREAMAMFGFFKKLR